MDFLKTNESFGFFYIKNILHKYIVFIDLIKEILSKNPSIDSKFKFLEHFKKQGVSFSIENNVIFLDSSLNKRIFNEFIPLYFSSKKSFEDNLNRFTNFYKIISSCNDLKIFNLQSIRTIVKNKSLINTIYKSKEEKLKGSYESYEQSELTYQLIEGKLDRFLNNKPPVIKPNLIQSIKFPLNQVFIVLLKNNEETLENLKKISYISNQMGITSGEILNVVLLIPYLNSSEKGTFLSVSVKLLASHIFGTLLYLEQSPRWLQDPCFCLLFLL